MLFSWLIVNVGASLVSVAIAATGTAKSATATNARIHVLRPGRRGPAAYRLRTSGTWLNIFEGAPVMRRIVARALPTRTQSREDGRCVSTANDGCRGDANECRFRALLAHDDA
jgi:hypothetical protein